MHGALITVGDRPDGGAVFALRFPAVIAAPARGDQRALAAAD